jgi:hypothetical protein
MKVFKYLFLLSGVIGVLMKPVTTVANHNIAANNSITKPDTNINVLSEPDKLKYSLIVNLDKPIQSKYKSPKQLYQINVSLENDSDDYLWYLDWTCGSEIWNIDNYEFQVYPSTWVREVCSATYVTIFEVPPHTSKTLYAYVLKKEKEPVNRKFKIGIILQRVYTIQEFKLYRSYFGKPGNLRKQKMNIIWSNSIVMP